MNNVLLIVKGGQPCNAVTVQQPNKAENGLKRPYIIILMQRCSTRPCRSSRPYLIIKTPIMAKSRSAVDGLDHWERIELKRVFEAHGNSSSSLL